ncbi:hypothetical protein P7K49_032271, partial [Saguinus oedipus]
QAQHLGSRLAPTINSAVDSSKAVVLCSTAGDVKRSLIPLATAARDPWKFRRAKEQIELHPCNDSVLRVGVLGPPGHCSPSAQALALTIYEMRLAAAPSE